MLPVVSYGLARLVLFVLSVVVLGLLGAGRVVALFGGLVVSLLLSYVLLRPLRDRATAAVVTRVEQRRRRVHQPDEDEAFEDAQVDAQVDAGSATLDAGAATREDVRLDDTLREGRPHA